MAGKARLGGVWCDSLRCVQAGGARRSEVWCGAAGKAVRGMSGQGTVRSGSGKAGEVGTGSAWLGAVWHGRHGKARAAWQVAVRQGRRGLFWLGAVRFVQAGKDRLGLELHGMARQAWQGLFWKFVDRQGR